MQLNPLVMNAKLALNLKIHGKLNCHASGTVEDTFDRHNISLIML